MKIGVMCSGNGTNFENIVKTAYNKSLIKYPLFFEMKWCVNMIMELGFAGLGQDLGLI